MGHAMTDIPEDVMRLARRTYDALGRGSISDSERIARAILADRAAQAERMARLEEATIERCAQAAEKWRRKKLGLKPGTEWFDPCGRWDGEPLMEEGRDRDLIAAAIRALSQEGSEPS